MLHGIARFCQTVAQQTNQSSDSDNARKQNAAQTFATACAVIGALQPVCLCKAAQPLLLQLLKVRLLLKSQWMVPRVFVAPPPQVAFIVQACKTDCISTQRTAASTQKTAASMRKSVDLLKDQTLQNSLLAILEDF